MARGRMIDKRVSNSKKIGKISDATRVLWFMIYPHLDREGRIAFDDLEDLKDEIIPKFDDWDLEKIGISLNELADIGLIHLYSNRNKLAMEFVSFEDFQTGLRKDREAPSKIDPLGVAPEDSGGLRITPALRKEGSLSLSLSIKEGRKEGSKERKKEKASVTFNFETEKFENITKNDLERWKKTYPACDINQELLYMADWLISNPSKRKVNYPRFISNWLRKQQDQGGTKKSRGTMTKKEQYMNEQKKKFLARDKNDKPN